VRWTGLKVSNGKAWRSRALHIEAACTVDVVRVELLLCVAAFNMGCRSTCKARFSILLSRSIAMGLHSKAELDNRLAVR
jgi:hypothetical protein